MAPSKILDTHIHLWPSTSLSPTNHGWMTPGLSIAKRHGISDYRAASCTSPVEPPGFIYVETDRYLPAPLPDISASELGALSESEDAKKKVLQELETWAHEPLEELKFLRRIVEGTPQDGDGFDPSDSDLMKGCVVWAPFHLPTPLFDLYLDMAERVSGPRLWERIVGFRYLTQGFKDEEVLRTLLSSKDWLHNILRLREGRRGKGRVFDIGIDTHGSGAWQNDAAADMVQQIRAMEGDGGQGRVRFVLNHLCKPDLSIPSAPSSGAWLAAMRRLAALPGVYMKLSGGFNQFAPEPTPADPGALLERLEFYTRNVFELYGPQRVMFGSDWPICNIGGPGDENWELWRRVVARVVEEYGIDPDDVWRRTGSEAYGVEV